MKKIVSVWAIAALTLSAVFAADISIEYKTAGTVYYEEHKTDGGNKTTKKSVLDQSGYDGASGEFVLSASSDIAGFVLDIDPDAADSTNRLDQWYAWINFGNLQTTMGRWKSRYVNRVNQDAGNWEDWDYERYRPGVIGGKYARDIDNLTFNSSAGDAKNMPGTLEDKVKKGQQKLATSVAYTIRPSEESYFMIKGVIVNAGADEWVGKWGGAFKNENGSYTNWFFSGFAGELAFRAAKLFDISLAFRSEKRDELGAGVFFSPLFGDSGHSMLFGASVGLDLEDKGKNVDSNYFEFAADFRARFKLSEQLALTTMNNFSSISKEKTKGGKNSGHATLWDMVSIAYDFSDQLRLQCTVESETTLYKIENGSSTKLTDLGGFNLSFIPGATWSFSENASLTAGLKFDISGVGASSSYRDANSTTIFSIPVVIDIAL